MSARRAVRPRLATSVGSQLLVGSDNLLAAVDADVVTRWLRVLHETPQLFSGLLDAEGLVLDANRASVEGCGLVRAETVGKPFWEGGWWAGREELSGQVRTWCLQVRVGGAALRTTSPYRMGDGSWRALDLCLAPITDDTGLVTHVVATGADTTEYVVAQQQQGELLRLVTEREATQRALADRLQQALLTPPPESGDLAIVVRYRPAAHEAQVGGDWYDAFLQPDGASVLVIGDVVGHDGTAAAKMGQLRGLLRALAYTLDAPPAAILTRAEHAARGLAVDAVATAVLARVQRPVTVAGGHSRTVQWSNAGHLTPVLLHPEGRCVFLDSEPDLLLGVDPDTARHDHVMELPDMSTLLLFTDGLVERRGASLDDGLAALQLALMDLGEVALDDLCDTLLERMVPDANEDDIALLAVRAYSDRAPGVSEPTLLPQGMSAGG
ncbi:MAG: SpoIIE family protein phosphatase [Actinomycetota bacterium]